MSAEEVQTKRIGEYLVGIWMYKQKRPLARVPLARSNWVFTNEPVRRLLSKYSKKRKLLTFPTSKGYPGRSTSSNSYAIPISSNSTRLSKHPSISFLSWSTAEEANYSTTSPTRRSTIFPHPDWPKRRPAASSTRSSMGSTISTDSASFIAISSPKTCSWIPRRTSRSLTSVFLIPTPRFPRKRTRTYLYSLIFLPISRNKPRKVSRQMSRLLLRRS